MLDMSLSWDSFPLYLIMFSHFPHTIAIWWVFIDFPQLLRFKFPDRFIKINLISACSSLFKHFLFIRLKREKNLSVVIQYSSFWPLYTNCIELRNPLFKRITFGSNSTEMTMNLLFPLNTADMRDYERQRKRRVALLMCISYLMLHI